jgi:DUF4097 and DUF4098 domain-containing protein YvlB
MNVLSRITGVSVATLGAFLFLGAPAQAHHFEKHFPVTNKPVITVRNPSGNIQVKAWNKPEVMITTEFASGKLQVAAEQAGDRIEVETQITGDNPTADELKADYIVSVPEESELQVRTDSGDVTVDSVHGNMTFDTVGANLQLSDVEGYVVIKSIDGSLVCTRCAGSLDATSISGNFQLIQPSMDSVRVQTCSGNILFDGNFIRRGIYILKNYSGTIEVRFSPSDSFDVTANSLYGKVLNEAPVTPDVHGNTRPPRYSNALFGSVNQGNAKVELSSFSGTIKILKRD